MLRDDQPLTQEITDTIVLRFKELLVRIKKSEAWASRSLDIKPSTLSQVLSGKYDGDAESRLRQIDKWTEGQISQEQSPRPNGFAKTQVALAIIGVAKNTKNTGRIGVVYGSSGLGKTMALQFVASEIPGTIYVRVTTAGAGPFAMWGALAKALRIPTEGRTAFQMQQAVVELLDGSDRMLLVDEVHKLCKKHKDHGLHALRDLHDLTGIPMVLCGTVDIKNYIDNANNPAEAVEQIIGRVNWWLDLTYAANTDGGPGLPTIDDIRKVLTANQMRVTPEGERYLLEVASRLRGGGYRQAVALAQMTIQKHGGAKPVTYQQLLDMQEERLGKRAAKALEVSMELDRRRTAVG